MMSMRQTLLQPWCRSTQSVSVLMYNVQVSVTRDPLPERFGVISLHICRCERLSVTQRPARLPEFVDQIAQNTPVLEFGSRIPPPPPN